MIKDYEQDIKMYGEKIMADSSLGLDLKFIPVFQSCEVVFESLFLTNFSIENLYIALYYHSNFYIVITLYMPPFPLINRDLLFRLSLEPMSANI